MSTFKSKIESSCGQERPGHTSLLLTIYPPLSLGLLLNLLWRVTALMGGGGATGTRGQVPVSFPHHIMRASLTPGPWKAVVLIKCSWILSWLRVSWARKLMLQLHSPHSVSRSLPWVPTSLLVPALFLALSLTQAGPQVLPTTPPHYLL